MKNDRAFNQIHFDQFKELPIRKLKRYQFVWCRKKQQVCLELLLFLRITKLKRQIEFSSQKANYKVLWQAYLMRRDRETTYRRSGEVAYKVFVIGSGWVTRYKEVSRKWTQSRQSTSCWILRYVEQSHFWLIQLYL